jgi:hypothetical protein
VLLLVFRSRHLALLRLIVLTTHKPEIAKPGMLVRAVAPFNNELLLLIVWQTSRTLPHSQCMLARRGLVINYAG